MPEHASGTEGSDEAPETTRPSRPRPRCLVCGRRTGADAATRSLSFTIAHDRDLFVRTARAYLCSSDCELEFVDRTYDEVPPRRIDHEAV